MDIYPYQTKVAPRDYPVENLEVTGFRQGLQDSEKLPTAARSVADAITGGVQAYQQGQQNQATIALTQAKAKAAEAASTYAPLKAEAEISHYEALAAQENAKASSLALQSKNDQVKYQRKHEVNSLLLGAQDAGSVKEFNKALSILEANPGAIAEAGFDISNNEKGKNVILDQSIDTALATLPTIAARFNDPALTERAKKVSSSFKDAANRTITAASGKPISYGELASTEENSLDSFIKESGVSVPGKQQGQVSDATVGAAANTAPAQGTPVQAQPSSPDHLPQTTYTQKTPSAPEITFPQSIGEQPAYVLGKDVFEGAAKEDLPITKRHLDNAPTVVRDEIKDLIKANIARGETPDQADRNARQQWKATQLSASQLDEYNRINEFAIKGRQTAARGQAALDNLRDLTNKHPEMLAALGSSATVGKAVIWLRAHAGSKEEREFADNIGAEIKAVSEQTLLDLKNDEKLGVRNFDQIEEQRMLKSVGIPDDAPIERYISAMQIIGAKAEEASQRSNIIKVARQRGYSWEQASSLAQQYRQSNPATVVGDIDGDQYLVRNQNKDNEFRWLDQKLGINDRLGRDKDGRVIAAPSADNLSQLQNNVKGLVSNAAKFLSSSSESSLDSSLDHVPDHLAIPDRQPQGVTEATLFRMALAESSGNPNAVSRDEKGNVVAEGLMQFTRKTGKHYWDKAGFEGEYNPFDPEKSIVMAKLYMDDLLTWSRGDTRVALAAYNAGPGNVDKILRAQRKADQHMGDSDWGVVKHYLPKPDETVPYVEKIMGDREGISGRKNFTQEEFHHIYSQLPTTKSQQNARAFLSDQGVQALASVADVKSIDDVKGTILEKAANLLMAANPFTATKAQAEDLSAQQGPGSNSSSNPAEDSLLQQGLDAANQVLPAGLKEFAAGTVKGLMFGGEDEIFALGRMAIHGESWEEATAKTSEIRDHLANENKSWYSPYNIGQVYGTIESGRYLTKLAPNIFGSTNVPKGAVPTLGQSVRTGAKVGAVSGGIAGYLGGEGSNENRVASAGRGLIAGTVVGGVVGTAAKGIETAISSDRAKNLFGKLWARVSGASLPETFNKAEKQISKTLGSNFEAKLEAAAQAESQSTNPATSLLDYFDEVDQKKIIRLGSHDPAIADELHSMATNDLAQQPGRVDALLDKHAPNVPLSVAGEDASKAVAGELETQLNARQLKANEVYDIAKKALLDPEDVKVLAKKGLEAIPRFTNSEVKAATQNPEVAKEIENALTGSAGKYGTSDWNAFDVLQKAKQALYKRLDNTEAVEYKNVKEGYMLLTEAMHKNSDYRAADLAFQKASDEILQFNTKGVRGLGQFYDPQKALDAGKFVNKLLSLDKRQITDLLGDVTPQTVDKLKTATISYIREQAKQGNTIPDFAKKGIADKFNAVVGRDAAKEIFSGLDLERKIASRSKLIMKLAPQTAEASTKAIASAEGAIAPAIEKGVLGAFAAYGTGNISVGAYSAYQGVRALNSLLKAGSLKSEAALSKQISEVLIENPQAGIDFIDKVSRNLAAQGDNAALKFFNRASAAAREVLPEASARVSQGAAQELSSYGTDYKPQTAIRNRTEDIVAKRERRRVRASGQDIPSNNPIMAERLRSIEEKRQRRKSGNIPTIGPITPTEPYEPQ